jgi:hypothetical protein
MRAERLGDNALHLRPRGGCGDGRIRPRVGEGVQRDKDGHRARVRGPKAGERVVERVLATG